MRTTENHQDKTDSKLYRVLTTYIIKNTTRMGVLKLRGITWMIIRMDVLYILTPMEIK